MVLMELTLHTEINEVCLCYSKSWKHEYLCNKEMALLSL